MSDSVKKWYDMQDDSQDSKVSYIFESPDGGKTVTSRRFGADIKDREVVFQKENEVPSDEDRKEAYKILAYYNEDSIRLAAKILDLE